jgi:eukaryotic-like serine/threonine-protein kinase
MQAVCLARRSIGMRTTCRPRRTSRPTEESLLREALGMAPRARPPRFVPGQILDRIYEVECELGAGAMGRVYRARDLRLGRKLAIKLHDDADAPERLLREASALARLAHPNVVTVYGVGTWRGCPWVAMEYAACGTARDWLAAAPRTPREILELYVAAGRGLAAAHAAGLVHCDFKPDNVLVGADGRARVADFGLARDLARSASIRGLAGTPMYMAPEQLAGAPAGAAADQFAFALALWEALTGASPFRGIARDAIATPLEPTRLSAQVERTLRRALAFDAGARWPSMFELLAALHGDPALACCSQRLLAGVVALDAWPRRR